MGFSATGPGRDEDSPRQLELYRIYILASSHGPGAGQALLDATIGEGRVFLWVAEVNPRAQSFYRRNRFELDGARKVEERRGELLPGVGMVR